MRRVEALEVAARLLVESKGAKGEVELAAALDGAGSLFSDPLSDETLNEVANALVVPRTPGLTDLFARIACPRPTAAFVPLFMEFLPHENGWRALQALPMQATASALLGWAAPAGTEFWALALVDKAKLFTAAPGVSVELLPDTPWAFLQWADFEGFDLAFAHGLKGEVVMNDLSLLQYALELRFNAPEAQRAGWRTLAMTLAARQDVDRQRRLLSKYGSSLKFKKGLTPAGMVKEAVKLGREPDPELLAALS